MINDDLNALLTDALAIAPADLDLKWNISIGAVPTPDGRAAILVQLIVSCASPLLGQRIWHVLDVPPDVFYNPESLRRFAFDLLQHLQALRQQALQVSNAQNGRTGL